MKLGSILALISSFAFAIMATAADTSFLRKSTKGSGLGRGKPNGVAETTGYAGVVIVMDGVTSQDGVSNDIVSKCLVNAFNTIHKNADDDYELSNAFVVKSIVVPNSNNNTDEDAELLALNNDGDHVSATNGKKKKKKKNQGSSYYWLQTGYNCHLCDPDNDSSYLSQVNFIEKLVAKKNGNMHKALEAEFRIELIASGDEVFAKVGHCEIDFTRPAAATTTTTASATSRFDSSIEGMAQTHYEHEGRLTNVGRRKPSEKSKTDSGSGGYAGVTLSVHRVKDSLDWNKEAIPNCLVSAYNKVNKKSGFILETAFIQKSVSIPEVGDGGDYTYDVFWLWTGFRCNGNDDCQQGPRQQLGAVGFDALPAFLAAQGTDVHTDFQAEFCAELKQTGGPAMTDIADCDVQFTYTSPEEQDALLDSPAVVNSQEVSDIVALQEPKKEAMTSQIQIFHVTGSKFDIAGHQLLTTQAFLNAFNFINSGGDVTMTAIDLLRRIDIPQDDDDDDDEPDNDDNGDDVPFDRLWWASVTFTRMGTKEEMVMMSSDPAAHKAFEQLFYLKLKNSGMLAYADISGCDISFSYPTLSSSGVNSIAIQE